MKSKIKFTCYRPLFCAAAGGAAVLRLVVGSPLSAAEPADTGKVIRGEPIIAPASNGTLANPGVRTAPKPASTNGPTTRLADRARIKTSDGVGFDQLAGFRLSVTDEMMMGTDDALSTALSISAQIPEPVKRLNEKQVSISGFMLPVNIRDGKVTEFLLLRNQSMCCYGTTPAMNEYVTVRLAGNGVKPIMDQLVTVSGILHVGEMRRNRFLTGIYRMDGDKVEMAVEPPAANQ